MSARIEHHHSRMLFLSVLSFTMLACYAHDPAHDPAAPATPATPATIDLTTWVCCVGCAGGASVSGVVIAVPV